MAPGSEAKASAGYFSSIRGLRELELAHNHIESAEANRACSAQSFKKNTHTHRQAHMHIHKGKWCVKPEEKRRQFKKKKKRAERH